MSSEFRVTKAEYLKAKKVVDKYNKQKREEEAESLNEAMPKIKKLLSDYLPLSTKREGERYFIILCNCKEYNAPIDLDDKLEEIGKEHNLRLKFPYWYYPK